jgi:hypothetical protein
MPLPAHGPIDCRICWSGCAGGQRTFGGLTPTGQDRFRLVNDPGAWGAREPRILVLGMSKGNTQSDAMRTAHQDGSFDAVPFRKMRPRLLQVLQAVGLMPGERGIDHRFQADEAEYGWGSILRCSLTGWEKGSYSAASGVVLRGMSHPDGKGLVPACVRQHLTDLSDRTRLVILLGNAEAYTGLLRRVFSGVFADFVPAPGSEGVAFTAGGRSFVHVGHPSPLNGHLSGFLTGDGSHGQGAKREAARVAVRAALAGPAGSGG